MKVENVPEKIGGNRKRERLGIKLIAGAPMSRLKLTNTMLKIKIEPGVVNEKRLSSTRTTNNGPGTMASGIMIT